MRTHDIPDLAPVAAKTVPPKYAIFAKQDLTSKDCFAVKIGITFIDYICITIAEFMQVQQGKYVEF